MIVVNVYEAKAKLSEFLEAVAGGDRVIICKRNHPVAELRAVAAARTEPRPVGGAKGRLDVPPAFFEPLPDELAEAFACEGDDEAPAGRRPSKAAEGSASSRVKPSAARGRRP